MSAAASELPPSAESVTDLGRRSTRAALSPQLGCALAVLVTLIVYIPTLGNGFTNWDDDTYVTNNPLLAHPTLQALVTTPVFGNYSPLTIWSLAMNYQLAKYDPSAFHFTNLLLHLINTFLVFILVQRLTRGRTVAASLCALLFGIHPMHVESVAWVAGRKDVLYGCFYLVGLLTYLRYLDSSRARWLAATFAAFALSVASKPAAVVFPLTLLAVDLFRRRPLRRPVLLEKLPFLVVSGVMVVLTLRAQGSIGAMERMEHYSVWQRVMFASYGLVMYAQKLLFPVGLAVVYPVPQDAKGNLASSLPASLVIVLLATPLLVYAWRRSPHYLFGLGFFFINIALMLQFVTVGAGIFADRFTYIAYLGLFFCLAWWVEDLLAPRSRWRVIAGVVAAAALCFFSGQAWARCLIWKDSETLWNDQISKHPHRVAIAYNDRAQVYRSQGKLGDALKDYDEAIALAGNRTVLWVNKADVLFELNQLAPAVASYSRAISLSPDVPYLFSKRGAARLRLGDFSAAIEDFSRSLELSPSDHETYVERGAAFFAMHDPARAVADWRQAIALAPGDPQAGLLRESMGIAYQKLGDHTSAVREFTTALSSGITDPAQLRSLHLNRSVSWRALGRTAEAQQDLDAASAK